MINRPKLRDILINQIEFYLEYDNKKPRGVLASIASLFSARGKTGRATARIYLENIKTYKEESDTAFLLIIYRDYIKLNDTLKASTVLRRRVGEGLCKYFKLLTVLEELTAESYLPLAEASAYGAAFVDRNRVRDNHMEILLQNTLEKKFGIDAINKQRSFEVKNISSLAVK